MPDLTRYLNQSHILICMKAKKKADAIREVGALLKDGPEIPDLREFMSAVFQRESRFSTGVGHGVAIPHYRGEQVRRPAIGLGISREGIAWGEGQRAHIVFLVGWPNRHGEGYLKTVSEIAQLLSRASVRQQLLEAATPEEALEALKDRPGDDATH